MMTFKMLPWQEIFTELISWRILSYWPSLTQPRLMTMSISVAPSATADSASMHLMPLGV